MNKEVLLSIKGLQIGEDSKEEQTIETLTRGLFYNKNQKNYISYEESFDGEESVKSMVKFDNRSLEITRKGKYRSNMVFEEGKKSITEYHTPYGEFVLAIDTESIKINEKEDEIDMEIVYDMEMNYEKYAKCKIEMNVKSV